MVAFSGILDTGKAEDRMTMNGRLLDEKVL